MAFGVAAALQIFDDVIGAPGLQPTSRRTIQSGGKPAVDRGAGKSLATLFGAKYVLRGVARAAMADAFDQIAAAIPFGALALVRLEDAGPEKGVIPQPHQRPVIQRPAQLRGGWRIADRRQGIEIGANRQDVGSDDLGEMGIGKSRVIVVAVPAHAKSKRANEVVVIPGAQAGIAVRCQVGGKNRTERGFDALAAGKGLLRIGGMAARAIAGLCQRLAARYRLL